MPVLLLIQALENAQPGDRILWLAYGGGCDAFLLEATDKITSGPNRGTLGKAIVSRRVISSYGKYLQFRGSLPSEKVNPYTSPIILNREDPMVPRIEEFHPVITTPGEPTSELMAVIIRDDLTAVCRDRGIKAKVTKIRVWESPTACAELT